MKKLSLIWVIAFISGSLFAQWSGDGYFIEQPNCKVWGTYVTVEDQSVPGGVYYRVIKSNITVINVMPSLTTPGGYTWTQYRTFQNSWYPEFSREMTIIETL